MNRSHYFDSARPDDIVRDYPIGPAFAQHVKRLGREGLRQLAEARFLALVDKAWSNPFYARRWRAAGVEPGAIQSLDDLASLPSFSKADLMRSVEEFPPFGDYVGPSDWRCGDRVVMHTTSGTTGAPQPLFFGPRDREIQNALLARAYLLQGLKPEDVVHSVYGFGMVNEIGRAHV